MGTRTLGTKLSGAAGQPPLPVAASRLLLVRGLEGASLVPESLPSAAHSTPRKGQDGGVPEGQH